MLLGSASKRFDKTKTKWGRPSIFLNNPKSKYQRKNELIYIRDFEAVQEKEHSIRLYIIILGSRS